MNLTLQDRERRAYITGDRALAAVLGAAIELDASVTGSIDDEDSVVVDQGAFEDAFEGLKFEQHVIDATVPPTVVVDPSSSDML